MNILVIASPDPQLRQFLRLDPGAESLVRQPAPKLESPCDKRLAGPLGLGNWLEDWLL